MAGMLSMAATSNRDHFVALLAYHYPPENAIGGERPYRFAKYLSRMGYTCRVFTAAEQFGRNPNAVYVPDPFVIRPRSTLIWQAERALRKLAIPGEVGTFWARDVARAARAWIGGLRGGRVTIFSTFPPLGAHLAGWQLARATGHPWIADCRDPVVDEYAEKNRIPPQRLLYRCLEQIVARRAGAVIANTDAALDGWAQKFPAQKDKFHCIWNGFDPEDPVRALPIPPRDYKVLTHAGELYAGRIASPFLEAVARFIAAGRTHADRLRVRLIGPAQAECLPDAEFLRRAQSEGWLELVTEQIPHVAAREAQQGSDGLILLQSQSATQVPGKLFEYLQIGRPILAFLRPGSPAERLLQQGGIPYRCVYPDMSAEAVDNVLTDFLDLPRAVTFPSRWFEENFSAQRQAEALDSIIRSLHHLPLRQALATAAQEECPEPVVPVSALQDGGYR
jgi:glycosyltransferase involved in cell wall biosynthesis